MGKPKATKKESETFEVEKIIAHRVENRKRQYMVQWKGYPLKDSTWEPSSALTGCKELLDEYNKQNTPADKPAPIKATKQKKPTPVKITKKKKPAPALRSPTTGAAAAQKSGSGEDDESDDAPQAHVVLSDTSVGLKWKDVKEVVGATKSQNGQILFGLQTSKDKFWRTNEDVRANIPQLLIDYYQKHTTFEEKGQ